MSNTLEVPAKVTLTRKISGILSRRNSSAAPIAPCELPAHARMNPRRPRDTLTLRCSCGYVKRDVMCLGEVVDKEARLFHFCGGLFIVKNAGVECAKCRKMATNLTFTCAFCGKMQQIDVSSGSSLRANRWASQDSVQSKVILPNLGEAREMQQSQLASRCSATPSWRKMDSLDEDDSEAELVDIAVDKLAS